MAATLFYLVRAPASLATATSEIRTTFSSPSEIHTGAALSSLTFLRACIDEAMRLSPSVGGLLPREVLPGGITLSDPRVPGKQLHVPEGVVVGVPHYALHHNTVPFPDPWEFVPARWIVGAENRATGGVTTKEEVQAAQAAFCAFSVGPRGCIGKGLAYVEMTLTLARLLWEYDVRRAVGVEDPAEGGEGRGWGRERRGEMQLEDAFTALKDGVMVEFRRR